MNKRIVGLLLCIALSGCAVFGHPPADQVEREHVAGHYYQGDGLGTNITVHLREDGTYDSTWHGCLGDYGSASGTWALEGNLITFEAEVEREMMIGYLHQAQVKSSWPNYKLVPTLGSASPRDVLFPYFPDSQ